jgi:MFS family permease
VLVTSVIWSQGFHVWMPLPSSMTLALAEPERTGFRLGQMGAAGSIGFGAGTLVAFGLTAAGVPMRPLYFVAAAAAVLAALVCLAIPRNLKTPGPRLVFRRRYGLYYVLCLLDGWRRQIVICFVCLLLVKDHGTPVGTMLLLGAVCQAVNCVASPLAGRLIDRVGERRALVAYFACVTAAFFGYAFIGDVRALYVLFVADNLCWTLTTALTTYVNRITPPSERTPTLSMGVAMNHVGAVTMPLAAGLLWDSVSHQAPFFVGAVAAAASIFVALRVPRRGALPGAAEERATTDRTESTDQAKRRPG